MRINKYLAESGLYSRRGADRLLSYGRVTVNGEIAKPGMQVDKASVVQVDGQIVRPKSRKTYLKYYKPTGIVCTFDKKEKNNLASVKEIPPGVTYAGRLDKASEGLLLLTDDGDLIHELMTGRYRHEKEYIVSVDREVSDPFLEKLSGGIWLEELRVKTRPAKVHRTGKASFSIVLTQGLNRQIRRMCAALGREVRSLKRIRICNLKLGEMKRGEVRPLTEGELLELRNRVKRG